MLIHHINRKIIVSIHAEKAFDKTQHPFMLKTLNKCIERTCFHIVKAIYDKPAANILNNGSLNVFPVRSGRRQGCQLLPLLFNTGLEGVVKVVRQNKRHQNW